MGNEYRAKVFKSGNSVALRLPAALGFKDGDEMILREDGGNLGLEHVPAAPKKIDLTGIAGSIPWLKPLTSEDREFDERELGWDGKLLKRD